MKVDRNVSKKEIVATLVANVERLLDTPTKGGVAVLDPADHRVAAVIESLSDYRTKVELLKSEHASRRRGDHARG